MSFVQRLFTRLLPHKIAEDMEADSRAWIWMLKCKWGYERSFWDIGGIRWKAFGNPKIFALSQLRKAVVAQCVLQA